MTTGVFNMEATATISMSVAHTALLFISFSFSVEHILIQKINRNEKKKKNVSSTTQRWKAFWKYKHDFMYVK
jgi:hypothetical protein